MGQDQSTTLGIRHSPILTPTSSTTSHNRSLLQNKVYINQQFDGDDDVNHESSRISEENEEEEEEEQGIIKVVEGNTAQEEEEEIKLLRSLKKFDPFIKEQEKSFSLEKILGLKSSAKSNSPTIKENDVPIHPAVEMFFDLQAHLKEHMTHVNNEQRILLRRIAYVNEISSASAQTISKAYNQAKAASERVNEVAILKEQAAKAQAYAIQIFKSLTALEKHLDPEDRIQISQDHPSSKWPELDKLRINASKSIAPPFDQLKKSTTTNDLTTAGTSTSPLLEKVVVAGEPVAFSLSDEMARIDLNDSDKNNRNVGGASSSTTQHSSLALSRLRGLSSRSIRALDTNNDS